MRGYLSKYFNKSEFKSKIKNAEFKKNEIIFKPNDQTKYLNIISEGLIKLYSIESRGKQNIGVIYGPGDIFPLAWVIDQKRPAIYFEAITDCQLILIPLSLFQKQIQEDAKLSAEFTKRITMQFALCATTVNNLGLKFGKERLAYRLLLMASRFGQEINGEIILPYVSHSDLGAIVNMTRESVNIEMNKLVKQGVIEFDRLNIKIKNTDKLRSLLGKNTHVYFYDNI